MTLIMIGNYLPFLLIAFLAAFINAVSTIGVNMVFVPTASILLSTIEGMTGNSAVALCFGINVFANIFLLKIDQKSIPRSYWLAPAIFMTLATAIGAKFLTRLPEVFFGFILGIIIMLLGSWFLSGRKAWRPIALTEDVPKKSSWPDCFVPALAGFCGGLFGINGPPLIFHFGRKFEKEALRKLLLLLFTPSTLVGFIVYIVDGLFTWDFLWIALACIPALYLGTYIGNHFFSRLSTPAFSRIVGAILIIIGVRLILAT